MPSMRHFWREQQLAWSKEAESKGDKHRKWYWLAQVYKDELGEWRTLAILSLCVNAGLLYALWAIMQAAGK